MTDYKRHDAIYSSIKNRQPGVRGIGTYFEKSMHAALKYYYEPDESKHEIRVGGYIADIYTGEQIVEIQTGQLYALRNKLAVFLDVAPVMVVYPIPIIYGIETVDGNESNFKNTGPPNLQRKELRDFENFFEELYGLRSVLGRQGLTVCVVRVAVVSVEHDRRPKKKRGTKKKTTRKIDKLPISLLGEVVLREARDYLCFIPEGLPEAFTSKEYAKAANVKLSCGRMMLCLLVQLGILQQIGTQRRWRLYKQIDKDYELCDEDYSYDEYADDPSAVYD